MKTIKSNLVLEEQTTYEVKQKLIPQRKSLSQLVRELLLKWLKEQK